MKSQFQIKLSITLIIFATVISTLIATSYHLRLREQVIDHQTFQVQQIERSVELSLRTIEKAFHVFGQEIAIQMETTTLQLQQQYVSNPDFTTWDLVSFKERTGFDIYIIDEHNIILHSSFAPDVGLNFDQCCRKLARMLDNIRNNGEFYTEGIDIEQATGALKKYSYMATRDQKYIIQLGLSLQEGAIFKQFNFLDVIADLVNEHSFVNEINILNVGGYSLGEPVIEENKLPSERRQAFEQTLNTGQTSEIESQWQDEMAIFRYVHYISEFDQGLTKNKVIELVYHDRELQSILKQNMTLLYIQLLIVLGITVVISFIITSWVSRPMYLASHDSLTALMNRASFEMQLPALLKENKSTLALLMIDLDNFKMVNDAQGHASGDELLKQVALCIRECSRKQDVAYRLGGDEFILLMPETSEREAMETAENIILAIEKISDQLTAEADQITVSIGVALAPEHADEAKTLSEKADAALYSAKEKGKNQAQLYREHQFIKENK